MRVRSHIIPISAVAFALFAAVTVLRFVAGGDSSEPYSLLYVIPIVLLALEFGLLGGLASAALAIALVAIWVLIENVELGAAAWAGRIAALLAVGGGVGWITRLRRADDTRWFGMSNDMLCEASFDGYFTRLNQEWEERLGHSSEELMDRPFSEFVHPEDLEGTIEATAALGEGHNVVADFENRYLHKDGSWRWLLWSARSDDHRIYAVAKDITDRKNLEADRERLLMKVAAMARTDELTGLPNRRAWGEEVRRELARSKRHGYRVAVAMVDLDNFKLFNDERGHHAGDELLREAAANWRMAVRVSDFIARYGGEEFALLLPGCPPGNALEVIERLRSATPGGQTCSAGIALWDGSEPPEAALARADAALYQAKREGRNRTAAAEGTTLR